VYSVVWTELMHAVDFKTEMTYRPYNPDDGIAAFTDTHTQLQQVSPTKSVSIDTVCA
jgi:hypothetical protein